MQQILQLLNTIANQQADAQQINSLLQKSHNPSLFFSLVSTYPHILNILKLQNAQHTIFFNKYVFGSIRQPNPQQLKIMKQENQPDALHTIAQLYSSKQSKQFQPLPKSLKSLIKLQYLEASCRNQLLKYFYSLMKKIRSQNFIPQKEQILKLLALAKQYQSQQDKLAILDTLWRLDQKTLYEINSKKYLKLLITINQDLILFGYDNYQKKLKKILFSLQVQQIQRKQILQNLLRKKKCKWGMLEGIGIDYHNFHYVRNNKIIPEIQLRQTIKQLLNSQQQQIDNMLYLIEHLNGNQLIWLAGEFQNLSTLFLQYIEQYNPESQIEEIYVNTYLLKCIRQNNTKQYLSKTLQFYRDDVIISSYSSQKKIEKIFCMLTNCLSLGFQIQEFNDQRFFNEILKLLNIEYFYKTGCSHRVEIMCKSMTEQNKKLLFKTVIQNNKINNSIIILINALQPTTDIKQQINQIINKKLLEQKQIVESHILQYLANEQQIDTKILDILQQKQYQPQQIYLQNLKIIILLKNHRKISTEEISHRFMYCFIKYGVKQQLINISSQSKKALLFQEIKSNLIARKQICYFEKIFTFDFNCLFFNNLPLVWSWIANSTTDNQFYHNHWQNSLLLNLVKIELNISNKEKIVKIMKEGLEILRTLVKKPQVLHNSKQFYEDLYRLRYLYLLSSKNYIEQIPCQLGYQIVTTLLQLIKKFNHPLSRQYIQVILCRFYLELPAQKHDIIQKQMIQMLSLNLNITVPIILTLGYEMLANLNKQLVTIIGKFIGCHIAYIRGISQYYLLQFLDQHEQFADDFLKQLKQFWKMDKDTKKIMKNINIVVSGFKESVENQLEFLGFQRVQEYPSEIVQNLFKRDAYLLYQELLLHPSIEHAMKKQIVLQMSLIKNVSQSSIRDLPLVGLPKIIIIATLLEKVHNFGHIIRTLHTHNAMLVVSSRQLLGHHQCQQLIPQNHDVKIIQVKEQEQQVFISLQKKMGFRMIALQQCSNSVSLEKFEFPERMMMLLGNERLGAPSRLLQMADHLVEIPQAGKIRSLNVHVSMVISLWQYLKQHF